MIKIHTVTLDNKIYNLGFKVVTEDLKSLGLDKNPTILKYSIGEWYFLPPNKLKKDKKGFGGIWVARTFPNAKKLEKYMQITYSKKTRIFRAALDEILYFNDYRIKTNGIKMFEEILF